MATVPSSIFKYVVVFLFLSGMSLQAQDSLKFVASMSSELEEISGMINTKNGKFLAITDSGNPANIYVLDSAGKIVKVVEVSNAKNVDWETITKSDRGIIYVGDIGNNDNKRKDLAIYAIFEEDILTKTKVQSGVININYANQKDFPPAETELNYDAESLISFGDNLYLFTKNRTKPYTGYTYLYEIPTSTKPHEIVKIDSLFTGTEMATSWITDAALSPDKRHIILLSQDRFFMLSDFYKNDFFSGIFTEVNLNHASQKESVVFLNDTTLMFSDERQKVFGGNLYTFSFENKIAQIDSIRQWEVLINTDSSFVDTLWMDFVLSVKANVYYEVFNHSMKRVDFGKIGFFEKGEYRVPLTPKNIINGNYMLNIKVGNRPHGFFIYRFKEVNFDELEKK